MKAVIDRHTVNEAWLKTRASRAIVDKVVKSMAATKGVIGIEFGNLDWSRRDLCWNWLTRLRAT
jgi:hypothetical protein